MGSEGWRLRSVSGKDSKGAVNTGRDVSGECADDLLGSPVCAGFAVTLKSTTRRRSQDSTTKTKSTRNVAVGTTKKSTAAMPLRWFSRNERHVGDGGLRRLAMYFSTVLFATSIPSFASSPWMRGAPQRGFARLIALMRRTTSGAFAGRPRLLFRRQNQRNAERCQRTTVSGFTTTSTSRHSSNTRESQTQRARSNRWMRGLTGRPAMKNGELVAKGDVL